MPKQGGRDQVELSQGLAVVDCVPQELRYSLEGAVPADCRVLQVGRDEAEVLGTPAVVLSPRETRFDRAVSVEEVCVEEKVVFNRPVNLGRDVLLPGRGE